MYSDSSSCSSRSSISNLSDSLSNMCHCQELEKALPVRIPPRIRRTSVTSLSTNPEEDAYVMVLHVQNKQGLFKDLKSILNSKDSCDVTFLVGEEKTPVYGVRAIIASRSTLFDDAITKYEKTRKESKNTKISHFKKTLSKLNTFNCASPKRQTVEGGNDVMKKLKMPMETFDAESFQRLVTYIHCGTLTVDARTVIGLLNAAFMFGFPEVRQACWDFAIGCTARADNLHDLFESAKRYSTLEMTQELMKEMRHYTDECPDIINSSTTLHRIAETYKLEE